MEINITQLLFSFFGGLALFLFGMDYMSNGLKSIGSHTFQRVLNSLTKNRFRAIMVGTGITCLIQSSSATSVMVVGFVNAGLLSLKQAIAVVLGADIGTTFTAWIVSIMGKFKISHYALPVIAVGFFIFLIAKKNRTKMIGEIMLGFGILFLGLGTMSEGLKPLKESQYIVDIFARFGENPFLGILAGTVVTMIVQSSSATIAIVQVMAFQGLLGLDAALPILFGDNIGTTITAQLAAINGTRNARGVAMANSMFKIFGTILFIPLLLSGIYEKFIIALVPGPLAVENIMIHIAVAHSAFNIINVGIFGGFLWPLLLKIASLLSYGKDSAIDLKKDTKYLDPLLLTDPPIAIQQTIFELVHMGEIAKSSVKDAETAILDGDMKSGEIAAKKEDILDDFQKEITHYLIKISENVLDPKSSLEIPVILHSVNDVEKVGDYVKNLANYASVKNDKNIKFSPSNQKHLRSMFAQLYKLFDSVTKALHKKDQKEAARAIKIEDKIDRMKTQRKDNYIRSLNRHSAHLEAEMMAMDVANNIEKMGDHLISIAKAVQKGL